MELPSGEQAAAKMPPKSTRLARLPAVPIACFGKPTVMMLI